jgi:hypothetical protein
MPELLIDFITSLDGYAAADALGYVELGRVEVGDGTRLGYRIELVEWPSGHPDGITAADFS